jgi:hypothetical protein
VWLLEHFCINPLVLILTSNFGICRFWVNLMPCCTQYPHPLQMDYIYYKPNEQYLHLIRLAHYVAMLKHLSNTFIILIMKYSHNNLNENFNLIFLYNYIARFREKTPWCINWFVYASIAHKKQLKWSKGVSVAHYNMVQPLSSYLLFYLDQV